MSKSPFLFKKQTLSTEVGNWISRKNFLSLFHTRIAPFISEVTNSWRFVLKSDPLKAQSCSLSFAVSNQKSLSLLKSNSKSSVSPLLNMIRNLSLNDFLPSFFGVSTTKSWMSLFILKLSMIYCFFSFGSQRQNFRFLSVQIEMKAQELGKYLINFISSRWTVNLEYTRSSCITCNMITLPLLNPSATNSYD